MEFVEFFTQMHWSVIVLLAAALIFLIAELVIPGFGVCGIIGIICGIGAVVCEAIFAQSVFCVFFLIFLILLIFIVLFVIFSYSLNKGFLKKSPLIQNETALPANYGKDQKIAELIGKEGKITSICKPIGKAELDGKIYTVRSADTTIYPGEKVVVDKIKDNTIIVKYLGGENE